MFNFSLFMAPINVNGDKIKPGAGQGNSMLDAISAESRFKLFNFLVVDLLLGQGQRARQARFNLNKDRLGAVRGY